MSNYSNSKATIAANVYTNHLNQVTADMVKDAIYSVVDTLIAGGYLYKGVAHPGDAPATTDANVFYLATEVGTYPNFGHVSVADGEVAIFTYDGDWTKVVTGVATAEQVTAAIQQLTQELSDRIAEVRAEVSMQNQEISDFEEAITNQLDNFQPIVIDGDVTNAPDEEDITTDENDLLKFANRGTLHGMGYVILRRDKTFAAQVTLANTIYEIRYDFDLGGASVTIPSGCVLQFNGGSISNGLVDLNFCKIQGNAKIFSDVSGRISNMADCGWFGASQDPGVDCGIAINKAATISDDIYLGPGVYYFSTPIVIGKTPAATRSPKIIRFDGKLIYNGAVEDASLIKITSGANTSSLEYPSIYISEVSVDTNRVIYSDTYNSNCIGIDFENCICADIHIGKISGANTGIRLYGNGKGCSYNNISVGRIEYFNYGIRLYQDNGGWANENTISGARFLKYTSFNPATLFAIYMGGPETASDTYDKINSISINECCAENFGAAPAIYMRNAEYVNVNRLRCEGTDYVAKFVGACQYNNFAEVGYNYSDNILRSNHFDLTEATRLPFAASNVLLFNPARDHIEISTVGKNISSTKYAAVEGFAAYELANNTPPVRATKYRISGNCVVGLQFDSLVRNDRFVTISSSLNGRVYFLPLEAVVNGVTITDFDTLKQYTPLPAGTINFIEYSTYQILRSAADGAGGSFYIPQPITKFFIGFSTISNCTIDFVVNRLYRSYQTYLVRNGAARPTSSLGINDIGFEFFDTSLDKPIFWTGSGWVDATGAAV